MAEEGLAAEYELRLSELPEPSLSNAFFVSRPYTLPGVKSLDNVLVRQLIVITERDSFSVYGLEFSYGPEMPYRSTTYKFGSVAQRYSDPTVVVGYQSAVIPGESAEHTVLAVSWPLKSDTGDVLSEGAMNVRRIPLHLSDGEGRGVEIGKIHFIDEGTGRVLLFASRGWGNAHVSELISTFNQTI